MTSDLLQTPEVTTGLFIPTGYILVIAAWNSIPSTILRVNYRLETLGVKPEVFDQRISLTSARAVNNKTFPFQSGLLTSFTISTIGAASLRGQTYVHAYLAPDASNTRIIDLVEGYVYFQRAIAWPFNESAFSGNGFVSSVAMSPAAGADISQAVPTNALWSVGSILAKYVASTVVATRTPKFQITDGTNVLYEAVPGGGTALTVTASQTRTFLLVPGYSVLETAYDSNNEVRVILPIELMRKLASAYVISSTTTNISAADQWTVQANVEEWLNPTG